MQAPSLRQVQSEWRDALSSGGGGHAVGISLRRIAPALYAWDATHPPKPRAERRAVDGPVDALDMVPVPSGVPIGDE